MASPLFPCRRPSLAIAFCTPILPDFAMCGRYAITLPPEAIRQLFPPNCRRQSCRRQNTYYR